MKKWLVTVALSSLVAGAAGAQVVPGKKKVNTALPYPVMFVGQVPLPGDFTSVASTFGNHDPDEAIAPRGGDLFIRYPSGAVKNLTRTAGFGNTGFQGANSIAVREPCVHWSGNKALFSMVIGAPTAQFQVNTYFWQMYEVSGLGENETPVITKVPNQPANFNNVSPIYGTDGRILFTSDRPRNGAAHLYPQLDEYEEAPTVSGIWSLEPSSGDLKLLNHVPSGAFSPSIDSFGRVIFTRWDHLQRDQQADSDNDPNDTHYGTFDYSDESAGAQKLNQRVEVFPEPRADALPPGTNLVGNSFNQFFPWAMNEDGTSEETINHVGRHEFHNYFARVFTDDPVVVDFNPGNRTNQKEIENTFQLREDPANPGLYYATDAPEFATHAAGQLIRFSAPPTLAADQIQVTWVTPRSTRDPDDPPVAPDNTGHYRDPLPLSDGTLLAVHTAETREDDDIGPDAGHPISRYDFRIKTMVQQPDTYYTPGTPLTSGIQATVWYWSPDIRIDWTGTLWELSPVEVRARNVPNKVTTPLEQPELDMFAQAQVTPQEFHQYLTEHNLALIVSRDVTTRDKADKQQPFNLRVPGGGVSHVTANGKTYDISKLVLYQADQLRGLGGTPDPNNPALVTGGKKGRRVLARNMHDPAAAAANPPATVTPQGGVTIANDGSIAAFVPANRAMSWHMADPNGVPVVRERYWLTFQAGEVRVCASCHGINTKNQLNQTPPTNPPAALLALLQFWKAQQAALPPAPTGLSATAASTTSVSVTWTASAGAVQYEVARASAGVPFATVTTTAATNFTDNTVTAGKSYLYKVRAINGAAAQSPYTAPDIATTILFTDDPLVASTTVVKAVHVTELRLAINALRAAAGMGASTFTDPTLSNTIPIRAVHLQELRTALSQARTSLSLSSVGFTDSVVSVGATNIRAVHLQELRNAVK
jgi:hypothetical protein